MGARQSQDHECQWTNLAYLGLYIRLQNADYSSLVLGHVFFECFSRLATQSSRGAGDASSSVFKFPATMTFMVHNIRGRVIARRNEYA